MTTTSARAPIVVYVGIEWDQLPDSFTADAKLAVKAGVEHAMTELRDLGYDARWCGVTTEPDAAVAALRRVLEAGAIDGVLVGAGLRKTDSALLLFERLVNEIHQRCPHAALCFNSTPTDSAAALQRWLPIS